MKNTLPPSAANRFTCWFSVFMWAVSLWIVRHYPPFPHTAANAIFVMFMVAVGFALPELILFKTWKHTLPRAKGKPDLDRVRTKYAGLIASIGFLGVLYWAFPEYKINNQYTPFWILLLFLLPAWILLAPIYLYWADARAEDPKDDGLYQMGLLLTRTKQANFSIIRQHLLGWLVKGFFTPLMFIYMCSNLAQFTQADISRQWTFAQWYSFLFQLGFFLDVSLAAVGYVLSTKATGAHTRSTEPSMLGWAAALFCYAPFNSLLHGNYFAYESKITWEKWFDPHSALYVVYGCVILALNFIYVWSTIAFGGKFSNLTHRGIITHGPYRYTKHPAYIAKNIFWWLIAVPFINEDPLRLSVLLLGVNAIYYIRAKTEERHLMLDPVYAEYAAWIDRHGLFRFIRKSSLLRFLTDWRPKFGDKVDISAGNYN